jgi:hypothetical protein
VTSRVLLTLLLGCSATVPEGQVSEEAGAETIDLPSAGALPVVLASTTATAHSGSTKRPPPIDFATWPAASSGPRLIFVRAAWSTASLQAERSGLFDSVEVRRLAQPFRAVTLDVSDASDAVREQTLLELGVRDVPSIVLEGCDAQGGARRVVRVRESELTAALADCLTTER